MTPVKSNGLKTVTLYVNTPQKKLIKLEQVSTNNDIAIITINNYKENQNLPANLFSFDKSKYQNYLITEL
jgi:outer membrane lipoprotein-sorting protein